MAEEEVLAEVEAVQAVYGDDCQIIKTYPPHLHVHLQPRTADVTSQQFVEAIIGIQASPQYPEDAPVIYVVHSKGLDEQRQKHLISSLRDKALELVPALCSSRFDYNENEVDKDFLQSDSEKLRRQKFEAVLKLQQENSILMEPKNLEVLLPVMFLPQSVSSHLLESNMMPGESGNEDVVVKSGTNPGSLSSHSLVSNMVLGESQNEDVVKSGINSGSSFDRPVSKKQSKSNPKHEAQNSRKQSRQWIVRDHSS